MFDEKNLKEIESKVKNYLRENIIKTKQNNEFVEFFISNSDKSLNSANALFDLSTDKDMQTKTGYSNFDGLLWVINASYYSMFYMTRALLEKNGIKINTDLGVHTITFDVFVYYFHITGKLQRRLIEDLAEAKEDASQLLGKQKADELVESYFYEKGKRSTLTYHAGEIVLKSKAKTSLDRATKFNEEIKKLIL